MLNPQRNAALSKRKFEVSVITITLLLCVCGLLGMSIMSFFQTQSAFTPLNDPSMTFQGIEFGSWIAFLCALIFQYGQNAALYVKNTYTTGKVFINLFGIWNIKDTTLCWIVFWICAGIDAGTNCLWLYNQPDIKKQNPVFQTVEYAAMISVVFVEEVLGIVLQALAHSFTLWKQIVASENKVTKNKSNDYFDNDRTQQKQNQDKPKYQPQFADRPTNKNKPQSNQKSQQNQQQRRQEPSYDTHQQKPQNQSSSSMSAIQKGPQNNDYLTQMKEEQEKWQKRGLYDHGLDELGMEKPDW